MLTNNQVNAQKLQQKKLELLLEDLNNLSVQHYSYKFGQQAGQHKHYLYVTIGRTRTMFRYYDTITEVIRLVENLIKYRTIEYETEVEDEE